MLFLSISLFYFPRWAKGFILCSLTKETLRHMSYTHILTINLSKKRYQSLLFFWSERSAYASGQHYQRHISLYFFLLSSLLFYQKELSLGSETSHGLLSNKNIRISISKKLGTTPTKLGYNFWGVGEMFEVDFADMCAEKFPLMLMLGRANGQACADGDRGPPSAWSKFFTKDF